MDDSSDRSLPHLLVIGGGFAGLAAAYGAVENGSSVVLVEKLSTTGGNSAINGGQYASYLQGGCRAAEEVRPGARYR